MAYPIKLNGVDCWSGAEVAVFLQTSIQDHGFAVVYTNAGWLLRVDVVGPLWAGPRGGERISFNRIDEAYDPDVLWPVGMVEQEECQSVVEEFLRTEGIRVNKEDTR